MDGKPISEQTQRPLVTKATILERAAVMRVAAEIERAKADLQIQFAIYLEEIAWAWPEPRTAHWIRWGQYLKCSACGHMVEAEEKECPECKAKMEAME